MTAPNTGDATVSNSNALTKLRIDPLQFAKGLRAEDPFLVAARLSQSGYRVLPSRAANKVPYVNRWQHRATTNLPTMADWQVRFESPNFSILTGRENGVWILDIDGEQGFADLVHIQNEFGMLPRTWTVESGRVGGGMHLWFKPTPGSEDDLRTMAHVFGLNLDLRGWHGHAVLAGSLHKNGKRYRWADGCAPDECDLAALPAAWAEALPKHVDSGSVARAPRRATSSGVRTDQDPKSIIIGDGEGYGGFDAPIYKLAIRYFLSAGLDAPEEMIIEALWRMIQAAPKGPYRSVERYTPGGGVLERVVRNAREFAASVKS
jgi:hypothetical protein